MTRRYDRIAFTVHLVAAVLFFLPTALYARPDFSGTWYYGSATPFERPEELANKLFYSAEEAAAIESGLHDFDEQRLQSSDPDRSAPEKGAEIGQEADEVMVTTRTNLARIDGQYRTSLIVSPRHGRLPYRVGALDFFEARHARGVGEFDHPEMRPTSERCINVVGPMAPMVGWWYNANMRIVQTPDHFVLRSEMQAPRIIALSGAQVFSGNRYWEGESRAMWEEDTLVVHSRNFRPEISWFFFRVSNQLEVVERFELVSRDEIFYSYTVDDAGIFSEPMTVEMTITRRPEEERVFEYACHEGNYSFPVILRGARTQEQVTQGSR